MDTSTPVRPARPGGPGRRPPRPTPVGAVQGTLALHLLDDPPDHVDPPEGAPAARWAPQPADVVPIDRRLRREIDAWAPRFTQAAVEVAAAERPAQQLLRWTSPEVYRDLERRGRLVARASVHDPASGSPRRAAQRASGAPGGRPRVLSTRACVVSATAVEVSAHVRHGRRSRAVAVRFERREDRWVCTALEFA